MFSKLCGLPQMSACNSSVRRAALLFVFVFALSLNPIQAQKIIHVPTDAATIQAGINAAANGDTVLVAPGTYSENIDFTGKNITLTSSSGAASTIIDGHLNGIVVTFANGETRQAVLNGFTIQNAALPADASPVQFSDGIYVSLANPTITNNVITRNRGYGIQISGGGGYISGNTITYTSTQYDPRYDYGCDYDDGDGIFVGATGANNPDQVVIDHNTIEYNVGHCEGGGIGIYAAPTNFVITNNIIAHNQSLGFGGGIFEVNGRIQSISQNLIYDNDSGVAGGGMYISIPSEWNYSTGPLYMFITGNTIYGNTITLNPLVQDAWVDGSQIALPGYLSQVGFFNNLILADSSYSAVACWTAYQYLDGAPPVFVNSDILNAGGAAFGGWCTSPTGFGNISADPLFVNPANGDFHLQAGSPAIDSGFNAGPGIQTLDFEGKARIQNFMGTGPAAVDMGAFETAGSPNLRAPSLTALSALQSTAYYGQTISLSAAVTDQSSSPLDSGTVNLLDNWTSVQQSAVNSAGVAIFSSNSLAVGPHWFVASYAGNTGFDKSISSTVGVVVKGFSTVSTLSFSSNPVLVGQPLTMSATLATAPGNPSGVGTPTGTVQFISYLSGIQTVFATVPVDATGTASFTTSSLPAGVLYIQALFQPTGGFLASSSQNLPLTVRAPAVATLYISPNGYSITQSQAFNLFITVNGTTGNPTPTGTITVTSGNYSSTPIAVSNGNVSTVIPAGTLPPGTDVINVQYSGDSVYPATSGAITVTVIPPSFTIAGSILGFKAGATTGNQATVFVTPAGGFTGTVTLTASLASSPSGAVNLPTFSYGTTSPVTVGSANPAQATLTVTTVAPISCTATAEVDPIFSRFTGGTAVACIVLLLVPSCRRWRRFLALLLFALVVAGGVTACGGGGGSKSGCSAFVPGTTPGTYSIAITGTSGSITATNTVSMTIE